MDPKISVIVPVYKAENYLHRCVDSILAQTFTNFEVLLIDDGSPDKSGEICDEYALKDSRVRVIHQANGGVTMARFTGVNNVGNSEFITFVDADDLLPNTALNDLYMTSDADCDIIVGSYDKNYRIYSDCFISSDEYSRKLLSDEMHSEPWARLFRKSLFNVEVFNLSRRIVVGEDLIMNLRLSFINCRDVKIVKSVVYCYNDIPTSVMNTFNYNVDYLLQLYHLEKSTIPSSKMDIYMPSCIKGFLNKKNYLIEHYYYYKEWRKTDLHQELLDDISRYGYRLSLYLKLFLFFSNPISGMFHLIFRRVFNVFRIIR